MAKVFIEETTLSAIGDAIRTKTETTELINPADMAEKIEGITTGGNTAELTITSNGTYAAPEGIDGYTPITVNVPQDGAPTAEELTLTGAFDYRFANNGWNWIINKYGSQITTNNITSLGSVFYNSSNLENIPFEINMNPTSTTTAMYFCRNCNKLKNAPVVNNLKPSDLSYFFDGCSLLREIPDNYGNNWDWSYIENTTSAYTGDLMYFFKDCYSLRKVPQGIITHTNPNINYSYAIYQGGFENCYVLDEITNLAVPTGATWTNNAFASSLYNGTFHGCNRLKRLTFKTNEDGTPLVVKWKNQTIDLGSASNGARIGYSYNKNTIINYNSGITMDTRIYNDETYQALKDNPDAWTDYSQYSRYNKTSAIETINSLPDASAYLAANGGTNTIKFGGSNGILTDGGAINTMTEEEIAVATAKGWTVSFV